MLHRRAGKVLFSKKIPEILIKHWKFRQNKNQPELKIYLRKMDPDFFSDLGVNFTSKIEYFFTGKNNGNSRGGRAGSCVVLISRRRRRESNRRWESGRPGGFWSFWLSFQVQELQLWPVLLLIFTSISKKKIQIISQFSVWLGWSASWKI